MLFFTSYSFSKVSILINPKAVDDIGDLPTQLQYDESQNLIKLSDSVLSMNDEIDFAFNYSAYRGKLSSVSFPLVFNNYYDESLRKTIFLILINTQSLS